MDVETSIRIAVHVLDADDVNYEAAVQLFGDAASDPERVAEALLRLALVVANLKGPSYFLAASRRFAIRDT